MSKESYARGFCKAAEAAGVDPAALAKFAEAIYNTGGKIPSSTMQVLKGDRTDRIKKWIRSTEAIPAIATHGHNGRIGVMGNTEGIVNEYEKALETLDAVNSGGTIDPKGNMSKDEQIAYLKAHLKSLRAAHNVYSRQKKERASQSPQSAYHGSMYALTNNAPAVAISPSGKDVVVK